MSNDGKVLAKSLFRKDRNRSLNQLGGTRCRCRRTRPCGCYRFLGGSCCGGSCSRGAAVTDFSASVAGCGGRESNPGRQPPLKRLKGFVRTNAPGRLLCGRLLKDASAGLETPFGDRIARLSDHRGPTLLCLLGYYCTSVSLLCGLFRVVSTRRALLFFSSCAVSGQ